jgi:hypothetical protein
MAVRHSDPEPFAPRTSTMAVRHIGGSPGFVDEHETLRLEVELAVELVPAASQDVRTVLFCSVGGLFLRVIP